MCNQQAVPHRQLLPGRYQRKVRFPAGILAVVTGFCLAIPARAEENTCPAAPDFAANHIKLGAPGPWGRLEYERIPLENFAERFPEGLKPLDAPRWVFENYTPQKLADFLRALPLTAVQTAALLDTNHWHAATNGIAVMPAEELVRGLSREARQALYPVLGLSRQNMAQFQPFRFCSGGLDERLADSALPPEKIGFLRGLTYTNAGCVCLAIDKAVEKSLTTNEFQSLLESLYSVPAWRVNLRVTTNDDLNALLNYWVKDGRQKAMRPLLASLAKKPGGDVIGVGWFLPPYPKSRLYTYPDAATAPTALEEDCFYTAFNFFNDPPDPQFLNNHQPGATLRKYYDQVNGNPAFGDLLMLVNSSNVPVHICVYIADDIVFTKNGQSGLQPWVFMKYADMLPIYAGDAPLGLVKFRRKTLVNGVTVNSKPAPTVNQP